MPLPKWELHLPIVNMQQLFSQVAVDVVIKQTISEFSYSGLHQVENGQACLFVSNHRDIVLDSALLQNVLLKNGHQSTQITFGSNLMSSPFIIDLGKSNKMFTLYRGGTRNEIYTNAILHFRYIHRVINERKESVWIAQRDGRTKDGCDQTQVSLLKMLTMKSKTPIEKLQEFNIVPVAISYEYEPCDVQKVEECLKSAKGKYAKQAGEDLRSILSGIMTPKGRVHLSICKPVNQFLASENMQNTDHFHQMVAEYMDAEIHANYALNPINHVALDLKRKERKGLQVEYDAEQFNQAEAYFAQAAATRVK